MPHQSNSFDGEFNCSPSLIFMLMKFKWFLFLFACAYILDYVLGLCVVAPNIQLCEPISLGAAAVTALGALASNIFSGLSSSSISKDTRNWQHNENIYAREWQEDMYNKYQSPQALINQQLQAGVNPFISGDSVTSGNLPSASPAQAPQPPQFHFGNALGEGVQSYMQAQSIQAQNQSFQAQALHNLVTSALALTKEFGEVAGRSFFETMLPQLGLDDSANATKMFNQQLQSIQLSNQRQSIENELREKYGSKEAQSALDFVDQQITESVARIGKMASDAKVNDATIHRIASEVVRNFAEAGHLKALSTQISSLLPYMIHKADMENEVFGYNRDDIKAEWKANEKKRQQLTLPFVQDMRAVGVGADPNNNPVIKFIQEIGKIMPSVVMPIK